MSDTPHPVIAYHRSTDALEDVGGRRGAVVRVSVAFLAAFAFLRACGAAQLFRNADMFMRWPSDWRDVMWVAQVCTPMLAGAAVALTFTRARSTGRVLVALGVLTAASVATDRAFFYSTWPWRELSATQLSLMVVEIVVGAAALIMTVTAVLGAVLAVAWRTRPLSRFSLTAFVIAIILPFLLATALTSFGGLSQGSNSDPAWRRWVVTLGLLNAVAAVGAGASLLAVAFKARQASGWAIAGVTLMTLALLATWGNDVFFSPYRMVLDAWPAWLQWLYSASSLEIPACAAFAAALCVIRWRHTDD